MTKKRMFAPAALAILLTASAPRVVASRSSAAVDRDIHAYVVGKLDDFTATGEVKSADKGELNKINRDLALLYIIKSVNVSYKEPNKVRIEGSSNGSHVTFIINGTHQWVRLNALTTRRELEDSPGKRKSLMDMGLVSEYYLSYANARFLREASVDGVPTAVFDVTYKNRDDTSHHIIYIDPKTRVVLKRESYSQNDASGQSHLQAIYLYRDVKQVSPGVWFPTVIDVQGVDRKVAGSTEYSNIRVNVGLSDDRFKL